MDAEFSGSAETRPVTRTLSFNDDAEALISTFDNTMTVNWTAGVGPQVFTDAVRTTLGRRPVGITLQRVGEGLDVQTDDTPTHDLDTLKLDDSVRFVRIDLSDTLSAAWQRIDSGTVFAGLGDDTRQIDWRHVGQLIDRTAAPAVSVADTITVVRDVIRMARREHGGPTGAGTPVGV